MLDRWPICPFAGVSSFHIARLYGYLLVVGVLISLISYIGLFHHFYTCIDMYSIMLATRNILISCVQCLLPDTVEANRAQLILLPSGLECLIFSRDH